MKPSPADSIPGPSQWPREQRLLLACGQARDSAANDARIDECLTAGLDWTRVLRSASLLGMLSLLEGKLAARPASIVPSEVRAALRRHSRATHARNLQSIGELFALADLFAAHGLDFLPFKGPVLAVQAYGTLSLRPFADLDLIVRPADVTAACDLLASRKYLPRYHTLSAGQRANLIRFGCEHPFQRVRTAGETHDGAAAARRDDVDLHWNLFPPSFPIAFDPQAVWNRTETLTLAGRGFRTIGTDLLVLYLCAHGYAHHWNRLEWISALARLIAARPAGIDWLWIQREAARTGAGRVLELGLVLAGDWAGAPVPEELLAAARRRPAMRTLLAHVSARILRDPAGSATESTLNEELFFDLDARENWGRRVSYFLRRLVTPSLEDVEWVPVPARLPALYYFLRPLRLSLRCLSPHPPRPAR